MCSSCIRTRIHLEYMYSSCIRVYSSCIRVYSNSNTLEYTRIQLEYTRIQLEYISNTCIRDVFEMYSSCIRVYSSSLEKLPTGTCHRLGSLFEVESRGSGHRAATSSHSLHRYNSQPPSGHKAAIAAQPQSRHGIHWAMPLVCL